MDNDITIDEAINAIQEIAEMFKQTDSIISSYFLKCLEKDKPDFIEGNLISFYLRENPTKEIFYFEVYRMIASVNFFDLHYLYDFDFYFEGNNIHIPINERTHIYKPLMEYFEKNWLNSIFGDGQLDLNNEIKSDVKRALNLLRKEPRYNDLGFFRQSNLYEFERKNLIIYSLYAYALAIENYKSKSFYINKQIITFDLKSLYHIYLFHFAPDVNGISNKTYHNPEIDFEKIEDTIQDIFDEITNSGKLTQKKLKKLIFRYKSTIYELRTRDNVVNTFFPRSADPKDEGYVEVEVTSEISVFKKA